MYINETIDEIHTAHYVCVSVWCVGWGAFVHYIFIWYIYMYVQYTVRHCHPLTLSFIHTHTHYMHDYTRVWIILCVPLLTFCSVWSLFFSSLRMCACVHVYALHLLVIVRCVCMRVWMCLLTSVCMVFNVHSPQTKTLLTFTYKRWDFWKVFRRNTLTHIHP